MSGESEKPESAHGASPSSSDDDRDAILERRNRFIKTALAGLAGASLVAACSGQVTDPADAGSPQPCLSPAYDAGPEPCLKIGPDAAGDAKTDTTSDAPDDATTEDGGPFPCLAPLPPDSGD